MNEYKRFAPYNARMQLRWKSRSIMLEAGALMGILNVTPDSFSDGGQFDALENAVIQAKTMARDGASMIDIGGESTRPGAVQVSQEVELERVIPVIRALKLSKLEVLISIDTRKANVAKAALEAGADMVNDVTGLQDPAMRAVCAEFGVPAVIMHLRGKLEELQFSQEHQPFENVVLEVRDELEAAAKLALKDGVPSVILDPGFGFGKSLEQNLELLRGIPTLKSLGFPVLIGASRKSTLGKIAGVRIPLERDAASIAAHLFAFSRGADVLRVHDVAGHAQALRVWKALQTRV
jgi:dihydropteroate synthase